MNDMDRGNRDIEDALRASLERHARQAPPADLVAERVIRRSLDSQPARSLRRPWGTWALPALASAAVAATVVAVLAATDLSNDAIGGHPTVASTPTGTSTPSPTTSSAASTSQPPAPNTVGLTAFRAVDLTFGNEKLGWAIGTADCNDGSGGRCSAMVHTTDGKHWTSMKNPPADIGELCTADSKQCVNHVRFADDKVGYAYGESSFFMTTDGGKTWSLPEGGGAVALETLNSNVIRVTSSPPSGCPGPCNLGIEISSIGSTKWTPIALPQTLTSPNSVELARSTSHRAYLLVTGHTSGGANSAYSALYVSPDDGATWSVYHSPTTIARAANEPCPQPDPGGEIDSYQVAAGTGGYVSVLCATRQTPQEWFLTTSTDGGATFARQGSAVPTDSLELLTGDPQTELLVGGTDGLWRTGDAGGTWHHVAGITGPITFLGFESAKVGRCVTDNGSRIWTTGDGGLTWSAFTFPS